MACKWRIVWLVALLPVLAAQGPAVAATPAAGLALLGGGIQTRHPLGFTFMDSGGISLAADLQIPLFQYASFNLIAQTSAEGEVLSGGREVRNHALAVGLRAWPAEWLFLGLHGGFYTQENRVGGYVSSNHNFGGGVQVGVETNGGWVAAFQRDRMPSYYGTSFNPTPGPITMTRFHLGYRFRFE